jgi:hypothetical protein
LPPRSVVALLIVIPWPIILAVKVHMPGGSAIAAAAVVALAVIDTPPVVRLAVVGTLTVIRLLAIVALVEVVKREREWERDAKADLRLSRVLGCNEQTARREQSEKRLHAWNLSAISDFASEFCL